MNRRRTGEREGAPMNRPETRTLIKAGGWIVGLVALGLGVAYLSGMFRDKVPPGTVEAEHRTLGEQPTDIVHEIVETETAEVTGTLRATRRTQVSSKILAAILEIRVRAGDRVKAGDVLIHLDDRDARAKLEAARQGVAAAQADLERTRADYERYRGLLDEEIVSRQEFDQKEAAYKVAEAQLRRAREGVSEAETLLSHSVIRAPGDGVVVDKLAEAGDTATPGRPLLNLYDPAAFRLEAAVPEALASGLRLDDALDVRLDVLGATLGGRVEEIVPQAEAASRSVLIKVAVPREDGMVEGMFGRLLIPSRERARFCAPESAVREIGQLRFVDVVDAQGNLQRRQVTLGEHREYGRVEVLSGLEPGERVVLYGPAPPPFPVEGVTVRRSDLP
jgi:membrane fusion protein, multidrug efflux system